MFSFFKSTGLILFLAVFVGRCAAQGLTPESPEIVRAVNRAADYLQTEGARETRLGGKALIAMALTKVGHGEDHPLIRDTIDGIRKSISTDGTVTITDHIYTAGLVVMFLGELDPATYRRELTAYGNFLRQNQRTDGAWTYLTSGTADKYPSGDMSMTQYAVMALWTLHQNDFDVSGESVNRVGNWLVHVQNPEGAFAYQTTIEGNFEKVSWSGVRLSMSAAGMASVYVCRDLFGYNRTRNLSDKEKISEAFAEVQGDDGGFQSIGGFRFTVSKSSFETVQRHGNGWLSRNFNPVTSSTQYFFYYLYAFERYAAFRELAENKHQKSPPWYNRVAEFLLEKQASDGSWTGNLSSRIDTAYAVLFLMRSTNRTFEKIQVRNRYGGGNLLGGRGLPKLTDDIKVEDGKIVSLSEIDNSEQLMERLADMEDTDEDTLSSLAELPADEVQDLLRKNRLKMKKLVGHESARKRLAAVVLFGKSGDVTNAPVLIYALTDPDPGVAQAAQDALLRLARLPKDEPLPTGDSMEDVLDREKNIERWKNWYRHLDPEVVFEER